MPNVSPDEVRRLAGDLGKIIEYVGELQKTPEAPPLHAAPDRGVFRSDEDGERIGERARDAFPDTDGLFLKVPRVF